MGEGQSVTPHPALLQNKGDRRLDIHQERAVMASMLSGGDLFDLISVLHQIGILEHGQQTHVLEEANKCSAVLVEAYTSLSLLAPRVRSFPVIQTYMEVVLAVARMRQEK